MAFKIFLIYHSHIDIGYTERQERIENYQADFIKQAVDRVLSSKQITRSVNEKFKFTAEGYWAVEKYLNKYGASGEERLVKAIKTGFFELTGGYLHFAELLDYETLCKSTQYSYDFASKNALPLPSVAMSTDVNGMSWGYSDALYDNGVRYLATNINTHHGAVPFGKPLVPFYWQTTKGNKLLVWNGLTYHKANLLGLIPGPMVFSDPGIPGIKGNFHGVKDIRSVKQAAKKRIYAMIKGLKSIGYDYDFIPIMGGGCYTDNNPIGDEHCALIAEWNNLYGKDIEIVTATLGEFFLHLQKNVVDIPTYSGEWNDWWTDGPLSTPVELNLFRNASRLRRSIDAKNQVKKLVSDFEMEQLSNLLMLFAEHTWGHSQSNSDPCKQIVQQLDFRKGNYAIQANTLALQLFKRFEQISNDSQVNKPKAFADIRQMRYDKGEKIFFNDFFELCFDKQGVSELKNVKTGESLIEHGKARLGQPIYQIFPDGNRGACAGFGYSERAKIPNEVFYGQMKHLEVDDEQENLTVFRLFYNIKGAEDCCTEFTVYRNEPKISIKFSMLKNLVLDPEGMYLAFPFALKQGEWYLDKPNHLSKVGEQLPDCCCDYFSVIRGCVLKNNEECIVMNMYSSPLIMIGGLKLWEFTTETQAEGCLYSWLTNNKWETNFRTQCSGAIENRYLVEFCSHKDSLDILKANDITII